MAETKPPKVFISYAWEDELKTWVLEFAARLRSDGINAILDQWETVAGDQLPEFMEKSVRESDFVVFVCTPTYKRKSDRRKGGVGYEGHIITGEIFAKNNHRKFIPVLQKGKWGSAAPSWATSKLFIDLRGDPYSETSYQQLLDTLFGKSPTAPPVRDNTLREGAEHEVSDKAQREKLEQDVAERTAPITWKPTDVLQDGKPYISINITSKENRLINCYCYIKSLELNGVVRDDIKNELVKHTTRVSWSGGSGNDGIKHIDPTGFGKLNLASLDTTDFIRSPLQFETAKGTQLKDRDGNLLPLGKYAIELGLACSAEGIDFPEIPIKIGFEYIEEHDYFEDNRITNGRETRKVLRLLKIEPSASVSGSTKPKEVIASEKDIRSGQEKRMFYDLITHYELDFENANAETLSNFLFESLTRIMRTVTGVDKNDNSRTAEYQTSQIEYLDPKDGKTTQHALIVHGKKVRHIGKGDVHGIEPLAIISEMLIITVTQGVNDSRLRFDSNELPYDAFKNLIEWILADLGKTVSVQVKDDISVKAPLPKQDQPAIKTPEQNKDAASGILNARGDISGGVIIAGGNNVINVGKQEISVPVSPEEKHIESSKAKVEKSVPKKTKPPRKWNTAIIVALIGLVGTICAALISSPYLSKLFSPESANTSTRTFTPAPPTKILTSIWTPTEIFTLTATPLFTEITDTKGVQMVLVPVGAFTMGSDNGGNMEKPAHQVYLDAFYMDEYEVTNILYKACVNTGVCDPPQEIKSYTRSSYYGNPKYDDYPVIYVDWSQAKTYCDWRGARLPTDAEWEKAARGTDERIYPWGDGFDCNRANYDKCVGDTSQIGAYESGKSVYGIYDLAGNVWEWVSSYYKKYPYVANDGREEPSNVSLRVQRGGSWNFGSVEMQTTYRGWNYIANVTDRTGFRCARDANP